jgi:hypothetical protein
MIGALLGAVGGGIASAFGADRQAQEAARRERFNAQMASLDTAYSPFVRGQSQRLAQTERGPGAAGGFLGGALGGASSGMSLDNAYAKLDALKKGAGALGGTSLGAALQEGTDEEARAALASRAKQIPVGFDPYVVRT